MKRISGKRYGLLAVIAIALAMMLGAMQVAYAAPTSITTHDADEILSALQSDGDVAITLDADVYKEINKLPKDQLIWCQLGSGKKSIDLAGHDLEVSVNNHYHHVEWITLLDGVSTEPDNVADSLYMFDIPSGAALTIDDSSGNNDGEIMFNGYMHAAANGALGTQSGNYDNSSVLYRNVFLVSGGDLVFNGGEIETRSKEQYVSPGRSYDHVIGPGFSGDVWQQVNCVGITMDSGTTTINGGVIRGRGFCYMYSAPFEHGAWYLSKFVRSAAIMANGGDLVINDGTFEGKGGSNVLFINGADSVVVRAGSFGTHKLDKILVPYYTDGEGSGTGAPRYAASGYGTVGLDASYLDSAAVNVEVGGSVISTSEWDADHLDSSKDVTLTPKTNGKLKLTDGRNYNEIEGRELVWDGTSECNIIMSVDMYFDDYPWLKSYWVAVAESTKSNPEGTSPTIYMGGQKITDSTAAPVEKTVGYNSSYPQVQTIIDNGGTGSLSFDLRDLKPDGVGEGESFIVDFILAQNLQPYETGGYTQYYNCTRTIVVTIAPTNPEITVQPEGVYEDDTSKTTTYLSACATGATEAWYVEEWPIYRVLEADFDLATGYCTLEVPLSNVGSYYTCYFRNDYATVASDTVCVRYALNTGIVTTDTEVLLYTESLGGELIITGDLVGAFNSVEPFSRSVTWYKDGSPLSEDSRVHTIASTPHLRIDNPKLGDAGVYQAEVTLDLNGETCTFKSGTFTVTVVDGANPYGITRIDLYGIGKPHLGDIAPSIADVTTGDDRYGVDSLRWNSYPNGAEVVLSVPESFYEAEFKAADGYHFEYNTLHESKYGIPVYVDGVQVGWADKYGPGQDTVAKFSYTYFPVTLTPSSGLEEIVIEVVPGGGIDDELKSVKHFTNYGLVEADAESIASNFSAADLPSWASLDADGNLTGTVPADALPGKVHSKLNYKLSTPTGTTATISSGITFVILSEVEPTMVLPADENLRNHIHLWGECTDNGDGTHTRTCAACGGTETHEHMWDGGEQVAVATEGAPGTIRYTCNVCGATKEVVDPYENHGTLTKVDAVAPTCTDDGHVTYYVCDVCGLLFWDEDGKNPILDDAAAEIDIADPDSSDPDAYAAWYEEYQKKVAEATDENAQKAADKVVDPATGHDWGEWTLVTAPDGDTPGLQQRVCKNDKSHVEQREAYFIYYDLNGGTLDGATGIVAVIAGKGEVITLPAPVRSGYTFDYWQGSTYYAGDEYTVEGNHTFTAQWKAGGSPNTGDGMGALAIALSTAAIAALCVIAVYVVRSRKHQGRHVR